MVHDWFVHKNSDGRTIDIPLPPGDNFPVNPMTVKATEPDPAPAGSKRPPAYANQNSHWWDGSQIYGSDASTVARLRTGIVAGGANNQLATAADGARLNERGILYAPDYVINAGGIINVCTEYLGDGDASLVRERIQGIPTRLEQIWSESAETGRDPAAVADAMAQRLIGRG